MERAEYLLMLSASVQLGLRANFAVSCRGAPEFFSSLLALARLEKSSE